MHPLKNIVIANVGEFLFPRPVPGSEARMELIEHIFADHALCWAGDDSLVITQFPSHEAFVNDLCRILGYHNVQVATPLQVSGSLCENIVADTHLFPFLVETLRCSPNAQIVFCGATRQLYALLDRLRQERVEFQAPDLPFREHYGIVPYLDSKVGFHEFCLKLGSRCPDLLIPAGWICETVEQAIQTAATLIA
ncbi:MAG: hypothetical protein J2P36_40320, partial [Ktedonobacteraceae bacterium]|nr:hypothetical protein [Ktedonobacteraceae bacterium]